MADRVHVACLETVPEVLALQHEWDPLLARSRSDSLFLGYTWVATWWQELGRAFCPFTLTARDEDGSLVGLAPLMVGRGPGRLGRRLRYLMVVGQQGATLAEHLDLVVEAGREAEVVPLIARAMLDGRKRWDVLLLERVPAASPNLGPLANALAEGGVETSQHRVSGSPYLPLPVRFDEILAAKSRNFRRQWKNSLNRLAREGDVRFRLAGRDVGLDEAFDHLVRLHRARWGAEGGSFRTDAYLAFHRALSRKLLDADALLLALLEVGGRVVAARYDFVHAAKVWCFQGGWQPEYERMRVGMILLGHVLEEAIRRGLDEYDFLSGEEDYKYRWATAERELVDLEGWTAKPGVRLYRGARGVWRALRRRGRG